MTIGTGRGEEEVLLRVALLEEASNGRYENLECPDCRKRGASIWFTNPEPGEYRTWLLCVFCDFHSHVINTGRPAYFSEERRRMDLEEQDRAILKKLTFKKP
jgi:hypothetical protein